MHELVRDTTRTERILSFIFLDDTTLFGITNRITLFMSKLRSDEYVPLVHPTADPNGKTQVL